MDYIELLKNPKWQKIRLKVLERDGFICQNCFNEEETLHVHHRNYSPGKLPWEYPLNNFITLCKTCHEEETDSIKGSCDLLVRAIKENFLSYQIRQLACAFHEIELPHSPEVFMTVLSDLLKDNKSKSILMKMYFRNLIKASKNGKKIHCNRKMV